MNSLKFSLLKYQIDGEKIVLVIMHIFHREVLEKKRIWYYMFMRGRRGEAGEARLVKPLIITR